MMSNRLDRTTTVPVVGATARFPSADDVDGLDATCSVAEGISHRGELMVDLPICTHTLIAADTPGGDHVIEDAFRLTVRQTSLWAERKMHPGVPLHNALLTVRLTGTLDVDRLERAYHTAVDQLDFLRLVVDEREPRQWLTKATPPPLEIVDLSAQPERLDICLGERSRLLFTFPGWLHRSFLVRLSPNHHVFCVLFDRICADDESALLLVNYLGKLYDGQQPRRPRSFREYACHETRYRTPANNECDAEPFRGEQGRGRSHLCLYGQPQVGATPSVIRIWHDFGSARGAALDQLASSRQFKSSDAARARLALRAMLVLALASRASEQSDMTIAVPLSNRDGLYRATMGLIQEQVFLRVELTEGETFHSLFDKVHHQLVTTLRHGPSSLHDRDNEHVALHLLDVPTPSFSTLDCQSDVAPIWTQSRITFDGGEANFTNVFGVLLTPSISPPDTLSIGFDFPANLFSEAQRHRTIGHFERLLDAFLDDPHRGIADVDLLLDSERSFALTAARGPEPPTASDLIAQIARQCNRHPDKTAVIGPDGDLRYGELAARVAGFARRLHELGVGPESLVAVSLSRGADELTTMLAILTAGGAYIPLDPAQPLSRLCMILEDACPQLLVTTQEHPLAEHVGSVPTIFVEDEKPGFKGSSNRPSTAPIDPSALAYVLFTSGSTGRPKGVQISRGALSNYLASMVRSPGLGSSDLLLALATTMFDVAALDLFGALCAGATVYIADADTAADARRILAVLEREPISVMQGTPTLWRMLIETGWSGNGHLKMVVGGEALSPALASKLLCRGGELWNHYGATETTVDSLIKRIERGDDISIGKPIEHTQAYVLDSHGRLAPIGVAGELCIAGAGIARGYLGLPDLTEKRFVRNLFGPPGDRMYRTGDLARLRETGEFECLGRLDHQVKIRGFRVELGDIESTLEELACVSHAAVNLHSSRDAEARLVAYVVPAAEVEFSPHELTQHLRDRLPAYMIPTQWVRMATLPVTANGKADRRALPDPADFPYFPDDERRRIRPRTSTESALHRIWSRVLDRNDIGVDDDFLELGGHSVLAVKIFDEIHRTLKIDLPLSALLQTPTIASLATRIDDLRSDPTSDYWTTVVPIQPHGPLPPIFCVAGVGGNPMSFVGIAEALGEQQPFYGLQHRGVDGKLRPHTSIRSMAEEFVNDIRAVQPRGPYVLAGYSTGGLAAYEMAQLLREIGERVALVILFDTVNPLLSTWSRAERARGHFANFRARGRRYVFDRASDRVRSMAAHSTKRIRAKLATLWPYRYRLDALEVAGEQAESGYRPRPYAGDVFLVRSDARLSAGGGIPEKSHESNGWRDYIRGRLDIVTVPAGHLSMMDDAAAPLAAAEVRRALRIMA